MNNTHIQLWFNPSVFSMSELRDTACLSVDCLITLVWEYVMKDLAKQRLVSVLYYDMTDNMDYEWMYWTEFERRDALYCANVP